MARFLRDREDSGEEVIFFTIRVSPSKNAAILSEGRNMERQILGIVNVPFSLMRRVVMDNYLLMAISITRFNGLSIK